MTASQIANHCATLLLVAEEEARPRDAEVVSALLEQLAVVAVADEQSIASMPRSRVPVSIVSRSSVRLTAVIRPNHPTTNFSGGDPVPAPHLGGIAFEPDALLELDPEADHRELRSGATRRRDELVPHLRADGDEAVEWRASVVSIARKTSVPPGRSTREDWPWKVWTTTGAVPASSAAARPTAPAFAVWVCTTSGLTLRMIAREPPRGDRVANRRELARQARGAARPRRPRSRPRTPSTPRRERRRRRRASSRSRARRARGRGT